MNLVQRIRIKMNPNIIDTWDTSILNEEIVSYAINNGYSFNLEKVKNFQNFSPYVEKFKNNSDFLEYQKDNAKQYGSLTLLYNIYGKEIVLEFCKQDDDLAKYALLNGYNKKLTDTEIIQLIGDKKDFAELAIQEYENIREVKNKESENGENELALYIIQVLEKSPKEFFNQYFSYSQNTEIAQNFKRAFIQTAIPETILEVLNMQKDKEKNHADLGEVLSNTIFQRFINSQESLQKEEKTKDESFEKFLPYLDKINSECNGHLLNNDLKEKITLYLIEQKITFNDTLPRFVLESDEYIFMCLEQDPQIIKNLTGLITRFKQRDRIKIRRFRKY